MDVAYQATIQGTASSSSTLATINFTGRSVGELAFVLISRGNTGSPTGVPPGWSLLNFHSSTYRHMLYYKTLEAIDLGSLSWSGFTASFTLATAAIYTGHDPVSPIESYSVGTFLTASGQTLNLGSVTTYERNILVFAAAYSTVAKTFDFATESLSERLDYGSTTPDFWHYVGDKNNAWAGGTFTPSTSTLFISAAATYRGGFVVAVNSSIATALTTMRGSW